MNQPELEGLKNVQMVRGDMFSRAWQLAPLPTAGKRAVGTKRGKTDNRWKAREERAASVKRGKVYSRCRRCQARVNTLKNPDWFKNSAFLFIVCYLYVVGYCLVSFFTLLTQKLSIKEKIHLYYF